MHTIFISLVSLVLAACVYARSQTIATELSFGHEGRLSRDQSQKLSNFNLLGEPSIPALLSNKIILTPPAPGNVRGAVWGSKTLQHSAWITDVEFRATGPERGGGKLTIWLTKDGEKVVGTSSIYTVRKFDGLALSIDGYTGTAGTIRGFLNDGTTDFKSHHSVDSLAFGHCNYAYRNLGRLSRISIKQDYHNFRVEVDGNLCFESAKIRLPVGYAWGLTAVSAEIPDTFEVYSMTVTTDTLGVNQQADSAAENRGQNAIPPSFLDNAGDPNARHIDDLFEVDAEKIKQEQQFADLHNRLQSIMKHVVALRNEYSQGQAAIEKQLNDLHTRLSSIPTVNYASSGDVKAVDKRLEALEQQIHRVMQTVTDTGHIEDLKRTVKETHSSLMAAVPRHGFLIFIFLGCQALLVGLYIIYKRRRANIPKKYL